MLMPGVLRFYFPPKLFCWDMIWFTFRVAVCSDSIASTISFIDANRKTVKHKSLRQKGRTERLEILLQNISELLGFCRNVSEQYVLTCDA